MKIDLRRTYGLHATKECIARTAIAELLKDYITNKEESVIVKHLQKRADIT